MQDLVRHVAYKTLSKRERKARHLAAAAHLHGAFAEEGEIAEMLASHYLAAVEAAPEAEDAAEIRARAGAMLARAGERAGSLGAPEQGQRYYDQAAALAEEPRAEAALLEQAGRLALQANRPGEARERLERAISLYAECDEERFAARASATLVGADIAEGRLEEAAARLEPAVAQLEDGKPTSELAAALAELGHMLAMSGHVEEAAAPIERALSLAERLQLPPVFVEALNTKGVSLVLEGRLLEARILLQAALERAHDEELHESELRAGNNLAWALEASDRHSEALELAERMIALARRRGDRRWELTLLGGTVTQLYVLGRWQQALVVAAELGPLVHEFAKMAMLHIALIDCERGQLEPADGRIADAAALGTSDTGRLGRTMPRSRRGCYARTSSRATRSPPRNARSPPWARWEPPIRLSRPRSSRRPRPRSRSVTSTRQSRYWQSLRRSSPASSPPFCARTQPDCAHG